MKRHIRKIVDNCLLIHRIFPKASVVLSERFLGRFAVTTS